MTHSEIHEKLKVAIAKQLDLLNNDDATHMSPQHAQAIQGNLNVLNELLKTESHLYDDDD